MVDENTIGVVGILGSTYTGEYEPVGALNDAIVEAQRQAGLGRRRSTSTAPAAPSSPPSPSPSWTGTSAFRPSRSINASGHKYGLVYPGVGWVIWRSEEDLPSELIFHVNYLGGRPAHFQPQLLPGRRPDPGPVLQLPAPGPAGLHRDHAGPGRHHGLPDQGDRERGPFRDPEQAGDGTAGLLPAGRRGPRGARRTGVIRCSTSRPTCGSGAGSCLPIRWPPTRRTSPCSGWSSGKTSPGIWPTSWPTTCGTR